MNIQSGFSVCIKPECAYLCGSPPQKVMVWLMYVTTFCFCLTWQFNQFILLVQALIIYTLDCVDFLTTTQVCIQEKKKKNIHGPIVP